MRYDGDRQASLSRHTDDGSITFSVLLSDDFEGGGTRYWSRLESDVHRRNTEPFAYILPKAGAMTTFPAVISHEGVQTTKGRRYLLIGFLAVDKIDPWTQQSTGLSWFSSWGSLNWVAVKFKEGAKASWRLRDAGRSGESWLASPKAGKILMVAFEAFMKLGDYLYPHRFTIIVNETASEDFLRALDAKYENDNQHNASPPKRASWFTGQQIEVGFDGAFSGYWVTRELFQKKFEQVRTEMQ